MKCECIYMIIAGIISVVIWVPSHILEPTPCSSFVLLFSAERNSDIGVVGTTLLSASFLLLCLCLVLIVWDTYRCAAVNRRSLYLEFDIGAVGQSAQTDDISAKRTLVHYTLGICCIYVSFLLFLSYAGLSPSQFRSDGFG